MTPTQQSAMSGRVVRVEVCDLVAIDRPWAFAEHNASAIDAHWQQRLLQNPKFFNGRIRLLTHYELGPHGLRGEFLETGFKEFLFWRETGEPEAGVVDAFGSALIWSSDGGVLLGRQSPGHINTGLNYLPGGFIDSRDVGPGGEIDIAASTAREVGEETGLGAEHLVRLPGFWLTFDGSQLSIGVEYRCDLTARALHGQIMAYLALDPTSELAGVVIVHGPDELRDLALAPFTRRLLASVLPA